MRAFRHTRTHSRITLAVAAAAAIAGSVPAAHAAERIKADNPDNLNLTTSWVGGTVPNAADVAVWDNTVTGPNSVLLGANLTLGGLKVTNPGGAVTIGTGSTLTLGTLGIDMSAATQDLTINAGVTLLSGQHLWNVAPGRTLTLAAVPVRNNGANNANIGGVLQVSTTGTTKMGAAANVVISDGGGNPFVTYGTDDWAATDATGAVVGATYVPFNASIGTTFIDNADVTGSFTQSGNGGTRSLRFADTTTAHAVTLSSSTTFTGRGILVTSGSAGGTINGGNIRPNRSSTAGASFSIIQNSTVGDLTIGSSIPNASSSTPVSLVKSGPGKLILTNNNGYTGQTFIHAGTLQLGDGGTTGFIGGGTQPVHNNGALVVNRSDAVVLDRVINGTGSVTQQGSGSFAVGGVNTYTGATNLNAGTIILNHASGTGTTGALNFNGGTLQYGTGITADLSGRQVNLNAGGGTVNTNGNNVTFANPIGNGGAGGLTKVGAGTLTLSGTQAYTGPTAVSGGTLKLNGSVPGAVTVNSGGTLAAGTGATVGTLTLGAAAGDAPALAFNDGSGIKTLTVATAGGLVANANTTLDIGNAGLPVGQVPLVDYSGSIGGGGFGAFSLAALPPRVVASLVNNTANTSVDLNVTGVDRPRWTGAVNGTWDIGTADLSTGSQNWKEINSGNTTVYLQPAAPGDHVLFDDLATVTTNVNIAAAVTPASFTVNNPTKNYAFTGAGIEGATGLLKQGAGTLTLGNAVNTYTGGTTIQGGTVQLTANNVLPVAGAIAVTGGTLNLGANTQDTSATVTLQGGAISNGALNSTAATFNLESGTVSANLGGSAGLAKTTGGTVVLTGTNTYAGATTVTAGTLQLGDGTTNGSISGNVTNGGTVAFNNGAEQTWAGNITGTAASIVKDGAGTLNVTGENQGNVTVNAGKISATGSGNNSRLARGGTLTINSGATVEVLGTNALGLGVGTNPPRFVLNTGGTLSGADGSNTAIYNGTFAGGTLAGTGTASGTLRGDYVAAAGTTSNVSIPALSMANDPTINVEAGANLNIASPLAGASGFDKTGEGTMTLSGANSSYSGGSDVQAGTLVAANATAFGTGGLAISNGATARVRAGLTQALDLAGQPAMTASGATGGTLDITDGALVVRHADQAAAFAGHTTVNSLTRNAFNEFAWNQPGVTSTTVATKVAGGIPAAVGILLNNDGGGNPLFYGDGTALPLFEGRTVDGNALLVKETLLGDGDLNGVVDTVDFALFQAGYTSSAPYVGFAFGDYDYNGVVDTVDFGLFQAGYQYSQSNPPSPEMVAFATEHGLPLVAAVVPEPATLGLLALGATGLLAGRRRRPRA